MKDFKCIMFDCMETIVDMTKLPEKSDYALWAFKNSKCEEYFKSFQEFYTYYKKAEKSILSSIPRYKEYDFEDIYVQIMKERHFAQEDGRVLVENLLVNFWENYKNKCYVEKEIKDTISSLRNKYVLGVVSNFKVKRGIEELLKYTGVREYFSFVINSSEEGWRKPHPQIYVSALKKSGFSPADAVFVGDDFINDYTGPRRIGMSSILFNKGKKGREDCKKIDEFVELKEIL